MLSPLLVEGDDVLLLLPPAVSFYGLPWLLLPPAVSFYGLPWLLLPDPLPLLPVPLDQLLLLAFSICEPDGC